MATVRIKKGRARPLWGRHPWVYSGAIRSTQGKVEPGDLVEVQDESGRFIARGTINPLSTIAVRILTWNQEEAIDRDFFRRRIDQAIQARHSMGLPRIATGYRLVHGEGDLLPGLVVDRFGSYLVVQIGTAGMYRLQEHILGALQELLEPSGIIGRSPASMAQLEGFVSVDGLLSGSLPDEPVVIEENGIRFEVDLVAGQKTGFYFDQRENRKRVADLAVGKRVLDCYCYSGAFSLYCAIDGQARQVLAVDSSPSALELLGRNLELNGCPAVTAIQDDVGRVLRDLVRRGERFDLVILDPPKLVPSGKDLESGLVAYRTLNAQAMRVLATPGLLVTCSCSGLVPEASFERMLMESAIDARREIRIVEKRSQAADHPVSPSCPESRYLKCYLCLVG